MPNPYQSPSSPDAPTSRTDNQAYSFAGRWLILASLAWFAAIAAVYTDKAIDLCWFPLGFGCLGLLILARVRLAFTLPRLIGSLTLVGYVLVGLAIFFGENEVESTQVKSDEDYFSQKQLIVVYSMLILVIGPPWWTLQRAFAKHVS